jgi:hypothetical protein
MDNTYEIFRGGLMTTIKIKDYKYNIVEFTITQYMQDEHGKDIVNSKHTTFYTPKQLEEFFTPILNDLKARFNHENHSSESNT